MKPLANYTGNFIIDMWDKDGKFSSRRAKNNRSNLAIEEAKELEKQGYEVRVVDDSSSPWETLYMTPDK
jgi:hypothetical protein